MNGDLNPIADAYSVIHVLFGDWTTLEPYASRLWTIFLQVVGMILIWNWVTGRKK
jgi:hypothetical protein